MTNFNINIEPLLETRRLDQQLRQVETRLNQLSKRGVSIDPKLAQTPDQLRQIAAAAGNSANGLQQLSRANQIAAKTNSILAADLDKTIRGTERLGIQTRITARRFAGYLIASRGISLVVDSLDKATRSALEFNRELVRAAQLANVTVASTQGLARTISNVSTTYGTSATELARVAQVFLQAGKSISETQTLLSSIGPTVLTASFPDLKTTANSILALNTQFRLLEKQSTDALDSLNIVAKEANTSVAELFDGLRRGGAAFAALSGATERATGSALNLDNLREFSAIFATVIETTRESAATVGTSLRTILPRLSRRETVDVLREFGIEVERLNQQTGRREFIGAANALKAIQEGLSGLAPTDTAFIRIAEQLGGLRQFNRVIPLLTRASRVQELYAEAQESSGSVALDAADAQEDLTVKIERLQQKFAELTRTVVGSNAFQTLVDNFVTLSSSAVSLANALEPLIPLLVAVVGVKTIGTIGGTIGGFIRGAGASKFNSGGSVRGSISAMTTKGEVFVEESQLGRFGGAANVLAYNKFNSGGRIPGATQLSRGVHLFTAGVSANVDSIPTQLPPGVVIKRSGAGKFLSQNLNKGGAVGIRVRANDGADNRELFVTGGNRPRPPKNHFGMYDNGSIAIYRPFRGKDFSAEEIRALELYGINRRKSRAQGNNPVRPSTQPVPKITDINEEKKLSKVDQLRVEAAKNAQEIIKSAQQVPIATTGLKVSSQTQPGSPSNIINRLAGENRELFVEANKAVQRLVKSGENVDSAITRVASILRSSSDDLVVSRKLIAEGNQQGNLRGGGARGGSSLNIPLSLAVPTTQSVPPVLPTSPRGNQRQRNERSQRELAAFLKQRRDERLKNITNEDIFRSERSFVRRRRGGPTAAQIRSQELGAIRRRPQSAAGLAAIDALNPSGPQFGPSRAEFDARRDAALRQDALDSLNNRTRRQRNSTLEARRNFGVIDLTDPITRGQQASVRRIGNFSSSLDIFGGVGTRASRLAGRVPAGFRRGFGSIRGDISRAGGIRGALRTDVIGGLNPNNVNPRFAQGAAIGAAGLAYFGGNNPLAQSGANILGGAAIGAQAGPVGAAVGALVGLESSIRSLTLAANTEALDEFKKSLEELGQANLDGDQSVQQITQNIRKFGKESEGALAAINIGIDKQDRQFRAGFDSSLSVRRFGRNTSIGLNQRDRAFFNRASAAEQIQAVGTDIITGGLDRNINSRERLVSRQRAIRIQEVRSSLEPQRNEISRELSTFVRASLEDTVRRGGRLPAGDNAKAVDALADSLGTSFIENLNKEQLEVVKKFAGGGQSGEAVLRNELQKGLGDTISAVNEEALRNAFSRRQRATTDRIDIANSGVQELSNVIGRNLRAFSGIGSGRVQAEQFTGQFDNLRGPARARATRELANLGRVIDPQTAGLASGLINDRASIQNDLAGFISEELSSGRIDISTDIGKVVRDFADASNFSKAGAEALNRVLSDIEGTVGGTIAGDGLRKLIDDISNQEEFTRASKLSAEALQALQQRSEAVASAFDTINQNSAQLLQGRLDLSARRFAQRQDRDNLLGRGALAGTSAATRAASRFENERINSLTRGDGISLAGRRIGAIRTELAGGGLSLARQSALNNELNELTQALQLNANRTESLASINNELASSQQARQGSRNFLENLLTGGVAARREATRGLDNFRSFANGGRIRDQDVAGALQAARGFAGSLTAEQLESGQFDRVFGAQVRSQNDLENLIFQRVGGALGGNAANASTRAILNNTLTPNTQTGNAAEQEILTRRQELFNIENEARRQLLKDQENIINLQIKAAETLANSKIQVAFSRPLQIEGTENFVKQLSESVGAQVQSQIVALAEQGNVTPTPGQSPAGANGA